MDRAPARARPAGDDFERADPLRRHHVEAAPRGVPRWPAQGGPARMTRRLAAIVAADVVGYSRLMGIDEAGTLAALKAHRRELADPRIAAHVGRIVKTTGDGLLVEFASVEVQRAMRERN